MEHPFETPHPSIQTQDQIFKLPSSKPCYSPNLSPLPIATTRSKNLKENRVSTTHTSSSVHSSSSWKSKEPQIHTAKTSLKANMRPRFSRPRNPRSASRTGINLEPALASPFVSRASSPIDNHMSNSNDLPLPIPRLGKRGLSDTFYNPNLPSQTHMAENLHEREKGKVQSAHTSPSSNVPPSVLLNLNTQSKQKRRKGGHRGTVSVDDTSAVPSYSQDLGIHEGHQRERRTSAPSTYSRRPRPHILPLLTGAPVGVESSKTRRSRLASGLEIIYNVVNDGAVSTGAAFLPGGTKHADDDGFVLPLLPLHNKNITTTTISTESEMDMDWRVGLVDFNRPPSQMCHYPTAMLSGWGGGDVFSSSGSEGSESESEEDGDDDKGLEGTQIVANPARASRTRTRTARTLTSGSGSMFDDPFGFGSALPDLDQSTFGDGAWGISTPLKMQVQIQVREEEKERKKDKRMLKATSASDLRSKNHDGGLLRVKSLPVMHLMGVVGDGWMEMNDYDQEIDANEDQDPYEQDQEQEQDMDLTTPLITGNIDAISTTLESSEAIQLVDRRGDTSPWILDSLISPPSRFLNTREETEEYPDEKDEFAQGQDQDQDDVGYLSSNTLSSSSGHNSLSFSLLLSSDDHIRSQSEATTSTATTSAAATAFTAKRTRSGTIVPSSHRITNNTNTNDPPGTRRTRSGTLVGPLPLASGSGVQLVVGNGNLSVRRTRERSGTILAGPSPVGARRTRSGKSTKERGSGLEISEKCMPTTSNTDRADEHHSGFNYDENLDGSDVEADMNGNVDVEPYIDALYMPRQCSSPDPIDFLRLAHLQDYDGMREKHHRFGSGFGLTIEEREDEDPDLGGAEERIEGEMEWCIADEPPSPILMNKTNLEMMERRCNKGGILSFRRGGRGNNKRRGVNAKERGKTMRTKFIIDGREEQADEFLFEPEEGEDSDDELLLGDGSTWYLGVEAG